MLRDLKKLITVQLRILQL